MSEGPLRNVTSAEGETIEELPRSASLLFAPLDKRAFGVAIGVAIGLVIFGITLLDVGRGLQSVGGLTLLDEYFAGYSVSISGALVGLAWGLAVGFCAGWFVAFIRNLVLAVSLFLLRERAELDETRDFLDHI